MPFPTNLYPRASWSGSLSIDAAMPVTAAPPSFIVQKLENISASGLRETIIMRRDEARNVGFSAVEPLEVQEWRYFFDGHAGAGRQFEFLLDRFTGPVLTFVNTVRDQDVAGVASLTQAASYQTVNLHRALHVASSTNQTVIVRTNVGSENHTLTHSGGTVVLTAVTCLGGAGNTKWFWTCGSALNINALAVFAQSGMVGLDFYSSAGSRWARAASVALTAGSVVTLVAQWQTTRSLNLYITVQGSATLTATFDLVGSSGIPGSLSTLANTITVMNGISVVATNQVQGALLHWGAYRFAYDDPSILASHFPLGRNYYSKCELLQATAFLPARQNPTQDYTDWGWSLRQGF